MLLKVLKLALLFDIHWAQRQRVELNGVSKEDRSIHGNGNGIRVNPVLNVSSANLFGLGSIFSGNKEKNKKWLTLITSSWLGS